MNNSRRLVTPFTTIYNNEGGFSMTHSRPSSRNCVTTATIKKGDFVMTTLPGSSCSFPTGTFHGGEALPTGTFHGSEALPTGTFHGGEALPTGTFHGSEALPTGTFHGGEALPTGTFHGDWVTSPSLLHEL